VKELSIGKPFRFIDRGAIALKGFDDPIRLFEVGATGPETAAAPRSA
jgi:hypothetical protein